MLRRLYVLPKFADLLNAADVGGGRPFFALLNSEFYAVAFHQTAESSALDGGEVHKHIVSFLTGNETVAFLVVEPFHSTDFAFIHFEELSYYN